LSSFTLLIIGILLLSLHTKFFTLLSNFLDVIDKQHIT